MRLACWRWRSRHRGLFFQFATHAVRSIHGKSSFWRDAETNTRDACATQSPELMAAIAENYSLGLPVEIGKIEKELKKLWAESEGVMTRASLINLAIYSQAPGSLEKNTQLIEKIAENHTCRAIVIAANCGAKESRVEAWISAHCHISRAGSKQICSEQLSFLLEGACTNLLPSIVFSHLDSDLPLHLWWQDEFPDPMDPQLWAWVDRLIYDSQTWKNFDVQMRLVETAQNEAKQRIVLCDLNWTRLDKVRFALAQFFDHPAAHHHFVEIENARIDFAPGFRSTAVLLAGWFGAQLNWRVEKMNRGDDFKFADSTGRKIDIELRGRAGARSRPNAARKKDRQSLFQWRVPARRHRRQEQELRFHFRQPFPEFLRSLPK